MKSQFGRAHAKWEDLIAADEFPDDTVYAKCEKDYNDSKVLADKHLKAAENALKVAPAVESAPSTAATGQITTKIDELLKPKELLLTAMTLEEADEWFKGYKAFTKHNERVLANKDVSVSRALLKKSIEAKLSSALRAAVPDTTPIIGTNGDLLGKAPGNLPRKESSLAEKAQLFQMCSTEERNGKRVVGT